MIMNVTDERERQKKVVPVAHKMSYIVVLPEYTWLMEIAERQSAL